MPFTTLKPKILAGQSLSSDVDCTTGTVLVMMIPHNWTSANVSLLVSSDGVDYYDVVERDGREYLFTAIPGSCISLGGEEASWKGMHLKLRSGSKQVPTVQQEDVEFAIVIQT